MADSWNAIRTDELEEACGESLINSRARERGGLNGRSWPGAAVVTNHLERFRLPATTVDQRVTQ